MPHSCIPPIVILPVQLHSPHGIPHVLPQPPSITNGVVPFGAFKRSPSLSHPRAISFSSLALPAASSRKTSVPHLASTPNPSDSPGPPQLLSMHFLQIKKIPPFCKKKQYQTISFIILIKTFTLKQESSIFY